MPARRLRQPPSTRQRRLDDGDRRGSEVTRRLIPLIDPSYILVDREYYIDPDPRGEVVYRDFDQERPSE